PLARRQGCVTLSHRLFGATRPTKGGPPMRPTLFVLLMLVGCARVPLPGEEPCELGQGVVGGHHEPEASEPVAIPRKRAWEAARGGEVAARPFVAARVAGWPRRRTVTDLPHDDVRFLRRLARDTWSGLSA